MPELIRINKCIAQTRICSRRKADEFISQGKVSLNGIVVNTLGIMIDPQKDHIKIDGEFLNILQKSYIYYALAKPKGYVCSVKKTCTEKNIITDLLPKETPVFPVGRLDKDSTGLLIATNDGRLTYTLTHPSQSHEKEYIVEVRPHITNGIVTKFRNGVSLFGEKTRKATVTLLTKPHSLLY